MHEKRVMQDRSELQPPRKRTAAVDLSSDDFRTIGHRLVDQLADFLGELPSRPVTSGETPLEIRSAVSSGRALPELGSDPASVVREAADLLLAHSPFQRASAVLRLYHFQCDTDRRVR